MEKDVRGVGTTVKIVSIAILGVVATVLAGCSHVERVELLANRWNAGEHKKCTFLVPNNLMCDGEQPVLHWEADERKLSLAKSIAVERGEYDASFSANPTDYALWDCNKTDVAISCALIAKPTSKDLEAKHGLEEDGKKFVALKTQFADVEAELNVALQRCEAIPADLSIATGACRIAANKAASEKESSIQQQMNELMAKTRLDEEKYKQSIDH